MRRKLRKSKHLLHCSAHCSLQGRQFAHSPSLLSQFGCCHALTWGALTSRALLSTLPCNSCVMCSQQSPAHCSPPFTVTHLHTQADTDRYSQSRDWVTHQPYTHRNLKKCSTASGRAEKRILLLKDFSVAQKKISKSAIGYLKWLLEWSICLM